MPTINESKVYSNINSLGTLYGIRREDYIPLPNDLVCDDLYRLLSTGLKRKRVIFDTESVVYEIRQKSLSDEFKRRVRLVGGGLSTIWLMKKLLNPAFGWISFSLWSHKVLRWFSPFYLLGIAVCTLLLPPAHNLWLLLVIIQLIIYLGAFVGWIFEKIRINLLFLRLPLFFVIMNVGFLIGIIRFFSKGQNALWERQETIERNRSAK